MQFTVILGAHVERLACVKHLAHFIYGLNMALKTLIQCEHINVQEPKISYTSDAQRTHLFVNEP